MYIAMYHCDAGWNSFANIIYIDQPGGTGFSYVDNPVMQV